ncbi:transposase [Nocardia sp. NBC_00508]|nr:Tn3 family transposase [Nocardia sp. NBC_00508]WUD66539.1 transposase [Nocardia sp. NBC_00508]
MFDLATNAVIAWTTEYYGLAVEQMRRAGRRIDDDVLAHISPAHSENINFFGAIEVDIDAELGPTGIGRSGSATPSSDLDPVLRLPLTYVL